MCSLGLDRAKLHDNLTTGWWNAPQCVSLTNIEASSVPPSSPTQDRTPLVKPFFFISREITLLLPWLKGLVKQTFPVVWCLYSMFNAQNTKKGHIEQLLLGQIDCNFCSTQVKQFCWFWEILSLPPNGYQRIFILNNKDFMLYQSVVSYNHHFFAERSMIVSSSK